MSVNNLHDSKSRVAICSLVGYVTIRYYICMIPFRDDYILYFNIMEGKRGFYIILIRETVLNLDTDF